VGRAIGPRKVHRYSAEFKVTAVKLSAVPGVQVQTVAAEVVPNLCPTPAHS
jgi:transposase-like protein